METGAEREVKMERGQGGRQREKDRCRDEERRYERRTGHRNERNTQQAIHT